MEKVNKANYLASSNSSGGGNNYYYIFMILVSLNELTRFLFHFEKSGRMKQAKRNMNKSTVSNYKNALIVIGENNGSLSILWVV